MRPSVDRAAPSSVRRSRSRPSQMPPSVARLAASACSSDASTVRRQLRPQQLVQRRLRPARAACSSGKSCRVRNRMALASSERRRGALMNQRHRNAERRVDALELTEVGQLAGARHVTDRREERVLHERSQQHVGAEVPGRLADVASRSLFDTRAIADDEARRRGDGSARVRRSDERARRCPRSASACA